MSGLAWGGLAIGLVIVAVAVGIPYFLTPAHARAARCLRQPCLPARAPQVGVAAAGSRSVAAGSGAA